MIEVKKQLANIITASRLIGTFVLIFLEPLSTGFFICYLWCGLSDILDGYIARKTNTISKFGSRLDSVSDLFLYTVMMIRIKPELDRIYPPYFWILIYIAVGIRVLCYIVVGIRHHYFISRHTIFNKLSGLLMFFLPASLKLGNPFPYSVMTLCTGALSVFVDMIYLIRNEGREEVHNSETTEKDR